MGILFTEAEKKSAYQRITSGNSAMGSSILSHTMKGHDATVNNFKNMGEHGLANRAECAYRLVERGMIVTIDQFYEKSNILLGGK